MKKVEDKKTEEKKAKTETAEGEAKETAAKKPATKKAVAKKAAPTPAVAEPEKNESETKEKKSAKKDGKSGKKHDKKNDKKQAEKKPSKKDCYTNRELSWLQFNERVLNEAGNSRVQLAERLTFASIFQSNLDEFFMVRVGTLMDQMHSKKTIRDNKTGMTSKQQVAAILNRVNELEKKKAKIYEQLLGELEPHGIRIINFNKLSNDEGKFLESYFDAQIAPFLSPMIIGSQQPFPFLANKQLYAMVVLATPKGKSRIGIVPCSNSVFKRLIEIPTRPGNFMLSEELILHFISKLYPAYIIKDKAVMRVTRNADIDAVEVNDEEMDYRDMMEALIKKRTRLNPVRVELSRKVEDKAKRQLAKHMGISVSHIINVGTPLDLSFVFSLQNYLHDKTELFYQKRVPQMSPDVNLKHNILDQVEKKDLLLSYPFESIKPFLKMLEDAAEDPDVVSIKMTLYRVASQSKVIESLIDAAENGKDVTVLVELRARFDEANNIEMSHKLEDAGCKILYGIADFKVHSKLCLITRKKGDGYEFITQIGTGNYNEKTSTLYTDLCLITANQTIGADASRVFASLQQGQFVESTNALMVAPLGLQNRILDMIDEQIELAKAGKPAYVGIKVNSLTDKDIMEKLIDASCAGVKIEMIVRGICCLKPQVPGLTENIRIISIVGRYLEHSRIYRFGTGKNEKMYIASADYMTRNTLKRVEVATPILDAKLKQRIRDMFELMMADDEKGKEQNAQGIYEDRHINQVPVNSQEALYQQAYDNLQGK